MAEEAPEELDPPQLDGIDDDEPDTLPTAKADLVALAIDQGIPSYDAWDMTVPALTKTLKKET